MNLRPYRILGWAIFYLFVYLVFYWLIYIH